MDERVAAFIDQNPSAAMVTLRADGTSHTARVGVGVVDGKIWSSGTQSRLRTVQEPGRAPHRVVTEAPSSRRITPSADWRAFGGHDIGSVPSPRRRRSGASVSPV